MIVQNGRQTCFLFPCQSSPLPLSQAELINLSTPAARPQRSPKNTLAVSCFCASGEFYLMLFLRRHLIENFYTPSSFFITNYVTRSPFLLVWSEERGPTLLFRDTSLRSRTKASETLNLPRPDGSLLVLNSLSIFNSVQFQDFLLFLTSWYWRLKVEGVISTSYVPRKFGGTLQKNREFEDCVTGDEVSFCNVSFIGFSYLLHFFFFLRREHQFCSRLVLQWTGDWFDVTNQYCKLIPRVFFADQLTKLVCCPFCRSELHFHPK